MGRRRRRRRRHGEEAGDGGAARWVVGERRRPSRERASPRAVARSNSFEARFKLRAGEAENLGTSPKQKFQVPMRSSLIFFLLIVVRKIFSFT